MNLSRRRLLGSLATIPFLPLAATAAESTAKPSAKMKLGSVTYNIAKDWDVPTLIKNFEATGFEGVELRTTHTHGVEVSLSKTERAEIKKRFASSKVELMGLGSAFDYHTPDQSKLRKDIEATKKYIVLAHDVGATGVKVRPNGLPKEVPVVDLYPTILDLAGFSAPRNLQGASLRPLLDNPNARWDRAAFTQVQRGGFPGHSVRTERWRYTEWDGGRRGAELYDHENDPKELRNVAKVAEFAVTVREMKELVKKNWPVRVEGGKVPETK